MEVSLLVPTPNQLEDGEHSTAEVSADAVHMGMEQPGRQSHTVLGLLALLLFLTCLLGPALDSREFWTADELRYAEVARQMSEYDHMLVPHLNGQVYSEKPPLYFWAVIVVERLVQDYKIAGRVVASLALAAAALALILLGRLLFSSTQVGILSAAVFTTCLASVSRGQQGLVDSLLLGISAWIVLTLLWSALLKVAWQRRAGGIAASMLLLAAALTKGPVGVLTPIVVAATVGSLWQGRRGVALRWIFTGLGFAVGGGLLWLYQAALRAGWWYWDFMLWEQVATRTAGAVPHQKPVFFYFADALPRGLLPWTLVLPGCLAVAWHLRHLANGRAALSLAAGGALVVVLFSCIPSKRAGYILLAFLLLVPVVAFGLSNLHGISLFRWRVLGHWSLALLAAIPGVLAIASLVAPALLPLAGDSASDRTRDVLDLVRQELPGMRVQAVAAAVVFAGLGLVAMFGMWQRRTVLVLWAVAATVVTASAMAHLTVVPAVDRALSPQICSESVGRLHDNSEPLVLLTNHEYNGLNYYTRQEHYDRGSPDLIAARVSAPDRLWILADQDAWRRVPEDVRSRFESIATSRFQGHTFVLFRETMSR